MIALSGRARWSCSLAAIAIAAHAAPLRAQSAEEGSKDAADIVVTGVFSARSIEDAPISITAITGEDLAKQVPVSSADVLRSVPGVFVNSSLGEIRNVVFSRGVSANSLDGAGGYYYVSLQEDGLPVEAVTYTNFGPDYFSRPDLMLDHVEALRGGTATVTGSNAPGGIFNYVSRNGKSHPGIELQGKLGLEGDGRNPYYRADAYAGGAVGNDLYYAVAGFYRRSDGARNPGYPMNDGGQVRANLMWDYGSGKLTVDAKYLDDHNGWFEFIPAFGYKDPKIARGFSNYSSVLPPAAPHSFTNPDGTKDTWDGSNLVHSQTYSAGLKWQQDLAPGVRLVNSARYSDNKTHWNTGALIFPLTLDDAFAHILVGTFGTPGTITYRLHGSSAIAAQVSSVSGFDHTVTVNNLPNQNVLQNGVLTQLAIAQRNRSQTFQDQLTLSAELGSHLLAIGGYFAHSKVRQVSGGSGFGLATLTEQPQLFDITITTPGGSVLRVTDPSGFGAQGSGVLDGDGFHGTQEQLSAFAGDTWQISEAFSIDGGVRFEHIAYDITNLTLSGAAPVNGGAGYDNDPLTLWDNGANTYGVPVNTRRSFNFWNYTAAANYRVSDNLQVYTRYTSGRKAGDFGTIGAIDTPDEVATQFPAPQKIQQVEVGIKYSDTGLRIAAFPFYSKLSRVGDTQTFIDNNTRFYTPATVYGTIETYGIEVDADADLGRAFNLRTALTLQDPRASGFGTWLHNSVTNLPADDVLVSTPDGDADNNPKFMSRTTLTWMPSDTFEAFLTHSYTGKRAANRANAFYLPGFSTFDLGASVDLTAQFKVQANVNNLFNQFGVMSWARTGGFFNSLDRQGLTKADVTANPDGLLEVVPIQPRSFWITATYAF